MEDYSIRQAENLMLSEQFQECDTEFLPCLIAVTFSEDTHSLCKREGRLPLPRLNYSPTVFFIQVCIKIYILTAAQLNEGIFLVV